MNALVKKFAKDHFPDAKRDLFACFIERGFMLATAHGHNAMVTMESWMFLANYESFRNSVLQQHTVRSLAHFPYDGKRPTVMGINFGVAIVGAQNAYLAGYRGNYCCSRYYELDDHGLPFVFPTPNERLKILTAHEFQKVPGRPLAYWVSPEVRVAFQELPLLGEVASPRQGLATTDNAKFCRLWQEVNHSGVGLGFHSRDEAQQSGLRWFPLNKGGKYRKWFGNNQDIVNWEHDGREIKNSIVTKYPYLNGNPDFVAKNPDYYFRSGITWGAITSAAFSIRMDPAGFIPSNAGMKVYADSSDMEFLLLGMLNSAVAPSFLGALSQTLNFDQGLIRRIPVAAPASLKGVPAADLVRLAATDWDAYERSWDFQSLPLLTASYDPTPTLESSYTAWITQNKGTIAEMKRLEEENNRLFIDAYGLADELTPDVPIEQITLTVNPAYRYGGKMTEEEQWTRFHQDTMKEFISYAVGCMFGRYSLEKPGLVLANSGETLEDYLSQIPAPSFMPDDDNVLPILGGEWFVDDIAERMKAFLKVTFGDENYEENLAFLEDGLGRDLRSYFLKDFYKDHVQTYKKRPIYWLFSSPKGSFNALIYMHRYRPDTASVILNDYLREFKAKLVARKEYLVGVSDNPSASQKERSQALKEMDQLGKMIAELDDYESDIMYPLATEQIDIDLDDGVKANYPKFGQALKKIPGVSK